MSVIYYVLNADGGQLINYLLGLFVNDYSLEVDLCSNRSTYELALTCQ